MEKISPLRASLDAFNKFRANRTAPKNDEAAKVHSNPFGITFKGTVLQMDVFDSSTKKTGEQGSLGFGAIQEKLQNVSKLTASAWVSTINKFSDARNSVVSFCGKVKQNTTDFIDALNNTKVELNFDFLTHSVGNLQKQPIGTLEERLRAELGAMGGV